jgi:DNA helicase INO80
MERADVEAPLSFCSFGASGPLNREGDIIHVPYSTKSPIDYMVPELLYLEGGLIDVPREASLMKSGAGVLSSMMNIWSTDVIQRSLESSSK